MSLQMCDAKLNWRVVRGTDHQTVCMDDNDFKCVLIVCLKVHRSKMPDN